MKEGDMRIRRFEDRDAGDWARIFHTAVHEIASRHYTPAQCHAWSPEPAPAERVLERAHDGRRIFVAADAADCAQGFIELESDGHIDCFYCAPAAVGQGLGVSLYLRLEEEARGLGLTELYVEASEAARGFFIRQGFSVVSRNDFERRGVGLHNYTMKKAL